MLTTDELEAVKELAAAMRELAESNYAFAKAQQEHAEALLADREDEESGTLD